MAWIMLLTVAEILIVYSKIKINIVIFSVKCTRSTARTLKASRKITVWSGIMVRGISGS